MAQASYDVVDFGTTKYGERAKKFILKGAGGVVLEVSDYGGKVVRLFTPDRDGQMKDVVVGFDDPSGWDNGDPYWGCIIGRYGNRIAAGKFSLNGVDYQLPALNNAPGGIGCNLHGGARGWDAYVWGAEPFVKGDDVGVVFTHVSPDGDEGFPGKVEVKVTYTLTAANVWRVDYEAVPDKETPINMTQHVYFNFKGEAGGTIEDHVMTIAASQVTPTDKTHDKPQRWNKIYINIGHIMNNYSDASYFKVYFTSDLTTGEDLAYGNEYHPIDERRYYYFDNLKLLYRKL